MIILNEILRANSLLIPPLGFMLNFTLLWLILHRTPKEMWLHSRVLLQTCILDIFFLVIMFIAIPYGTLDEDHALWLFDGYLIQFDLFRPFFNDPTCLLLLFLIWHFFFHLDVLALAIQFLYRYLVLNRSIKITIYRYLLFLIIPLICSFSINYTFYLINVNMLLLNNSNNFLNVSIDLNKNVTFIAIALKEFSMKIIIFLIILCYLLSYCVIIFCGRKMVKFVATNAMNERLKELNKQLTKSLLIIASYPLIFEAFILLFLLISTYITSVFNEGFIVYIIINWLPILNPLVSLWTFRPYREALMAPFKKATINIVP